MQNNRQMVTRSVLGAGERCWLHHIHPSADDGCHVAMVLGDDMDIFVLLFYWALHCDLQGDLAIQMEKWDGIVLYMPHAQNVGAPYVHSCV